MDLLVPKTEIGESPIKTKENMENGNTLIFVLAGSLALNSNRDAQLHPHTVEPQFPTLYVAPAMVASGSHVVTGSHYSHTGS